MPTSNCTVEKSGIDLEITNEKIRLFLRMLLLIGYHKLPDHRMYWEATSDAFMEARPDSIIIIIIIIIVIIFIIDLFIVDNLR